MYIDHKGRYGQHIRSTINTLIVPIHAVAELPGTISSWFTRATKDDVEIIGDYKKLETENQKLRYQLQGLRTLEAENFRLRTKLHAVKRIEQQYTPELVELLKVSLEPYTRKVFLNKGSSNKVFVRQPAVDAYGVVGQVTKVYDSKSVVTLITDPSHAIPIMVRRTGLRTIAYGTGKPDKPLEIRYLNSDSRIKKGDILVTSGMGGVFPTGYPVALVTEIIKDPNEPFLKITVQPTARIEYGKELLLLWPKTKDGNKKP